MERRKDINDLVDPRSLGMFTYDEMESRVRNMHPGWSSNAVTCETWHIIDTIREEMRKKYFPDWTEVGHGEFVKGTPDEIENERLSHYLADMFCEMAGSSAY